MAATGLEIDARAPSARRPEMRVARSRERYASREAYLTAVRAAAESLVTARWMLAEDVDGVLARAAALWEVVQKGF